MQLTEINEQIEHVERAVEHNTDDRLVLGLIAKGVWEVARQLAKFNYVITDGSIGVLIDRAVRRE